MEKLNEESRLKVKICEKDGWKCSPVKSLFPENWPYEEIAQAMKKAEELIRSGNNGKLVKKLDEETFERYCKEGGIDIESREFKEGLLKQFNNGELRIIEFGKFGNKFERNVMEYNGLKINIWGKYEYVDGEYVLSKEIRTLYPDR